MKRLFSILLSILIAFSLVACRQTQNPNEQGQGNEQKAAVKPNVLMLITPLYGYYKFCYKDTTWRSEETTEFYIRRQRYDSDIGEFGYDLEVYDGTIQIKRENEGNKTYYLLNGEKYLAIESQDHSTTPFYAGYDWSFDRRFFFEYAETDSGGKLYQNMYQGINAASSEAFIYKPTEDKEILLIKTSSPLSNPNEYRIDDFNLVILDTDGFDRAAAYEAVLSAHTKGEGTQTVRPEILYDKGYGRIYMTFECKRIPGLRYTMTVLWDENSSYVYCIAKNSLVAFDFGVSFDEIFENATAGWSWYKTE
ncbi:MAG: hypothetical protein IKZ82_01280 [Clostridia bacterium]|nr:hypothetical protein [Clostridia bacterium]